MTRRKKDLGDWGEEQACAFLVRHGFKIIERNYHTVFGEIDIVASYGGDCYFIEVKTRFDSELANDLAITRSQKNKLNKTVRAYCYSRGMPKGSTIMAGVIVLINKPAKKVSFRFCVYY